MEYEIIRSSRNSICLQIKDNKVVVRAHYFVAKRAIDRFVESKAEWITKNLERLNKQKVRKYHEGEKFLYLGKTISLKTILEKNNSAVLSENDLSINALTEKDVEPIVKNFYKVKTIEYVLFYLKKYSSRFNYTKHNPTFKFYKSKWGSCSSDDRLTFSAKLSMTPPDVIEYVVVHELAHTKIKNHSRIFWQTVEKTIPDYKKLQKWIKINSTELVL